MGVCWRSPRRCREPGSSRVLVRFDSRVHPPRTLAQVVEHAVEARNTLVRFQQVRLGSSRSTPRLTIVKLGHEWP